MTTIASIAASIAVSGIPALVFRVDDTPAVLGMAVLATAIFLAARDLFEPAMITRDGFHDARLRDHGHSK